MNRQLLYEKLIRAARHYSPASQVPYAFEKRVMAHLGPPLRDEWTSIARALCWSAGACCAIALGISIWVFGFDAGRDSPGTFSSELEQTILASIDDFRFESDIDPFEGDLEILQ